TSGSLGSYRKGRPSSEPQDVTDNTSGSLGSYRKGRPSSEPQGRELSDKIEELGRETAELIFCGYCGAKLPGHNPGCPDSPAGIAVTDPGTPSDKESPKKKSK
ncbi:MAG: hypothetical protein LYZ70_07360, partial [Nitrososphaerales archaeon]|nr:hypothetical protein [Nitrososphaerales archaeon]